MFCYSFILSRWLKGCAMLCNYRVALWGISHVSDGAIRKCQENLFGPRREKWILPSSLGRKMGSSSYTVQDLGFLTIFWIFMHLNNQRKVSETIKIIVLLQTYTIFLITAVVQGIVSLSPQGLTFKSPKAWLYYSHQARTSLYLSRI